MQNYPNPFGVAIPMGNPTTIIEHSIPNAGQMHTFAVQLKVYVTLGKEMVTLVNEPQQTGNYIVSFDISNSDQQIASGVYF